MKITKIHIKNFRSIKGVDLNLVPYIVFVGKKNSGKSNLMIALDAFFNDSTDINDFRKEKGKRVSRLSVTILFSQLNENEKQLYRGKLLNEGTRNECLVLRYTANLSNNGEGTISKKYEYLTKSLKLESPEDTNRFGGLTDDELYKSKSKIESCGNLPADFIQVAMDFLEEKGSNRFTKAEYYSIRDNYVRDLIKKSPHFGKNEYKPIKISSTSRNQYLGNYFFIPAVQNVEDETRYTARGKKNLNLLMNYVLDQMQDEEKKREKEKEIQRILKEIYHIGDQNSEIYELQQTLNKQLQTFDKSKLTFDAELPNLSKLIRDSLRIYIDDGIKTEVQYKGHGLQRYFMVVLFKVWSEKLREMRIKKKEQSNGSEKDYSSSTYFAIEEPELFLHPQYQRMMRSYLQNISEDEGHQVILNTHSPHFIEFNNMLQVAKVFRENLAADTRVIQPLEFNKDSSIKEKDFVYTWGGAEQRHKFGQINQVNMDYYLNPNRNEMFFADKVVLVEGQTEKMLFQAWANYFFGDDIALINKVSYIDCLGKFNFQHFIKILGEFQIPFVVIVDSDSDKSQKTQDINKFIRNDAKNAKGQFFELDPDFEGEFDIKQHELDYESGERKHKPYNAFKEFFTINGEPKENRLEALKSNSKLNQIFNIIYNRKLL